MNTSNPETIFNETIKVPLAPGETVRQDHFACPAGDDHRKRLYFTRGKKPDSVILWYCHNCGGGGAFPLKGHALHLGIRPITKTNDNTDYIKSVLENYIPLNSVDAVYNNCPTHVSKWLFSDSDSWGWPEGLIGYDPLEQAVVFSIYNDYAASHVKDIPDAIQHRYFRDRGPKCITTKRNTDTHVHMFIAPYDREGDTVVIVEDMLSALKVWVEPSNLDKGVYCMFGSNMELSELVALKNSGVNNVVVWLDNDNEQVKKNARTITQRASNLGLKTRLIDTFVEPKRLASETLGKILGGITFE